MTQHVHAHMSLSLDGFGTGLNQTREKPFGDGMEGEPLHRWMFEDAENNQAELNAITNYGAFIMGRNMFAAPGREAWEPEWKGWWGPNPPYHAPVFVLTHHARPPIEMEGGTVFHFVTEGPEVAMSRARAAAGDRNVVRNYLNAGAVDYVHLQISPVVLGRGQRLWDGLTAKLEPVGARATRLTTHMDYRVIKA
jgi:dihydrofolate reductase